MTGVLSGMKRELLTEEEMERRWRSAAGKKAARHSRPVSLKRGILRVNVSGSSWLYELTLKKKKIVGKLAGKMKGKAVKEIRFRIGEV